ncbi:MAG: YvcK family protein, partial [Desulfobulbaceae bacterium]|nr:YvcK family protein [Desulfobulbaceae bacterium]
CLGGAPSCANSNIVTSFRSLADQFSQIDTTSLRVVLFGGGTGLSNIVGGDSRREEWRFKPFSGMKQLFPVINSVVCVTDDGGSTGELRKDLPLIALGDLRHVLLSSIRAEGLRERYSLDDASALTIAAQLHAIFNYRFRVSPRNRDELLSAALGEESRLPNWLFSYIQSLTDGLFQDERLSPTLRRSHCFGNLLVASAIYNHLDRSLTQEDLENDPILVGEAIISGLEELSRNLGAGEYCVLPSSTTSAQLQVLYGNGVLVTSERKSAEAQRGYPVEKVFLEFCTPPVFSHKVRDLVLDADIIIFAPGSLYTSIIPILQVPGLVDLIKGNQRALKLLISNIWVQKGETDAALDDPNRKFHVSDMIRAYHRNIPGGLEGLFSHVLSLRLGDISGSVLQNYALEDKEPIYLDRDVVSALGYEPIEACIFSHDMLLRHGVVQHDPDALALAVRTLWGLQQNGLLSRCDNGGKKHLAAPDWAHGRALGKVDLPCKRYRQLEKILHGITTEYLGGAERSKEEITGLEREKLLQNMAMILWRHPDILVQHLQAMKGVVLIDPFAWKRSQRWDNVFSFYDPLDENIKIRKDVASDVRKFEVAFLVALGQSLLGNYALEKGMRDIESGGEKIGRLFCLTLRPEQQCKSFFNQAELQSYLKLSRMRQSTNNVSLYTRLINDQEGFTPPGLLFGLFYAWYLDNRFATHIEYKMSIMRNELSNLIPEQVRMAGRREGLITFFRESVFRQRIDESMDC